MRKTLPRVLEHVERALVVSLYRDRNIIHANPAMKHFLPGIREDMPMIDARATFEQQYGEIKFPFGLQILTQLDGPGDLKWRHITALGGLWAVASQLPDIEGYPPCAIVTYHSGSRFQHARSVRVHTPIAQSAALALELDEAQRELEVGSQMVAQAHRRLMSLADSLVENQSRAYATLVEEGRDVD